MFKSHGEIISILKQLVQPEHERNISNKSTKIESLEQLIYEKLGSLTNAKANLIKVTKSHGNRIQSIEKESLTYN